MAYATTRPTSSSADTRINGSGMLGQSGLTYDRAANRTLAQEDGHVNSFGANALNQLASSSPGGKMRFAGQVNEPQSTVTVGGVAARVDGQGNFDALAPVSVGTNTLSIVATDPSGNARTSTYEVTVAGDAPRILEYDKNGNLLSDGAGRTFEWDAHNQLVAVGVATGNLRSEFTYDGHGRRPSLAVLNVASA